MSCKGWLNSVHRICLLSESGHWWWQKTGQEMMQAIEHWWSWGAEGLHHKQDPRKASTGEPKRGEQLLDWLRWSRGSVVFGCVEVMMGSGESFLMNSCQKFSGISFADSVATVLVCALDWLKNRAYSLIRCAFMTRQVQPSHSREAKWVFWSQCLIICLLWINWVWQFPEIWFFAYLYWAERSIFRSWSLSRSSNEQICEDEITLCFLCPIRELFNWMSLLSSNELKRGNPISCWNEFLITSIFFTKIKKSIFLIKIHNATGDARISID